MDNNETGVAIMALLVAPGILWILLRHGRAQRAQPQEDPAQTQALWETAQRMERRIENLEMLLDSELPGWRSRSKL